MNKIKKVLAIIIVAIILIGVLLTVGIGNYFVNYAIARSGDGGNREIKEESKIEVLSEDEQLIEDNRKSANESAQNWASNIVNKKVEIKVDDGVTLRGTEYITDENTDNWAIVLHGYRAEPKSVLTIGEHFSEKGYNVLVPSMRACADSDGEFVGMGWLDKDDFVPESMCESLYDSANCIKDKLIISGAGHTDSKYREPDTYYNKIFEFIAKVEN